MSPTGWWADKARTRPALWTLTTGLSLAEILIVLAILRLTGGPILTNPTLQGAAFLFAAVTPEQAYLTLPLARVDVRVSKPAGRLAHYFFFAGVGIATISLATELGVQQLPVFGKLPSLGTDSGYAAVAMASLAVCYSAALEVWKAKKAKKGDTL